MIREKIQPANMSKDVFVLVLVLFLSLSVVMFWEKIFPLTMTPYCAYLIEKYPLENFSFIDVDAREQTTQCLYFKWKYNQKMLDLSDISEVQKY